jgi:Protein of unknown function (DUF2800)
MTAHAVHAPSAAHRWMNCPGSVKLSQGFSDGGSVFAREGTAAHMLAKTCSDFGLDADEYIDFIVEPERDAFYFDPKRAANGDTSFRVDTEMVDAVQLYLDVIRELQAEGYELEFEQRLTTPISPDVFGTGDAIGYHPDRRRVVIVDFKYGKGVVIEPEGNEQLLTYAAGVAMRYHNHGVDDAQLTIVQPRAFHARGPVRTAPIVTIAELQAHVEKAQAALASDQLRAGPWCKFCPAAGFCPEIEARVHRVIGASFRKGAMVSTDNPTSYSRERLAQALEDREIVAGWLKSVGQLAHNEGMRGTPPPGWKMVYANSHRKFINPSEACQTLELYGLSREEIFEPEQMRSPAQLEKELPTQARKIMATLTHSPKTKPILVSEDDPRPSIDPMGMEGFEGLYSGTED